MIESVCPTCFNSGFRCLVEPQVTIPEMTSHQLVPDPTDVDQLVQVFKDVPCSCLYGQRWSRSL